MAPSEAAAERVFALADSMFTEEQRGLLSDSMTASVMLAYNNRRPDFERSKKKYKLGQDKVPGFFADQIDLTGVVFPLQPESKEAEDGDVKVAEKQ